MSNAASKDEKNSEHDSRSIVPWSLLILCSLWIAYHPVLYGGLVYDDCEVWGPEAVDQLGFVREGISVSGMAEAVRCRYGNNWQPVSWWSHMLDASLFGPDKVGPAHGVNLLIHAVNACLVFLLYGTWCDRAGAARRVSDWLLCIAALVWAIHPLRVESVAWLIERKDVLSALFVLVGLWCFDRYRRGDAGRQRGLWLALLTLSYALALGAKASALSFPGLLLLLDLFIYRRDPRGEDGGLKSFAYLVPPIALSLAYLVVNLGATVTVDVPLTVRIQHALGSLPAYAAKIFWPVNLSYFYPYPQRVEIWRWGGGLLLVGGAVWLAWRAWPTGNSSGTRPWPAVGLLWFLAAMVPMLGLVQVGDQGMADRYTYLPSVGLGLLVIGLFELAGRKARWLCAAAAAVVLVLFVFLTRQQSLVWHDEGTLYSHALEVDPENYHATYNLAVYLLASGQQERGHALLQQALSFPQVEAGAADVLARLAKQRGEAELAEQYWRRSLQRKPHGTQALQALAWHYYDAGRLDEAETLFRRATQVPAGSVEIPRHTAYAVFLYSQKRYTEARAQMEEALRRNPRDGHARKLQELLDQL